MKATINRKLLVSLCATPLFLCGAPSYGAQDALVKFSTLGNGVYNYSGIRQFDWQETGDLAVSDDVTGLSCTFSFEDNDGVTVTAQVPDNSFTTWATIAKVGDVCTFNVHAHARLQGFLNKANRGITVPTLSRSGGVCPKGSGCFEVTAALSGVETARIVVPFNAAPGNQPKIEFLAITGDVKFYLDQTPDSNVVSPGVPNPTNFIDATPLGADPADLPFMTATFSGNVVVGDFVAGQGGHNYISAAVAPDSYDKRVIDVDKDLAGNILERITGTTHYSVVSVPASGQQIIAFGNGIGNVAYLLKDESESPTGITDQRYKGDSNTYFAGEPRQQEACETCRVTGGSRQTKDQQLVIAKNEPTTYPRCEEGDISCCELNDFPPVNTTLTYTPMGDDIFDGSGQVGAPTFTSLVRGEWTHQQHGGSSGQWTFRSGSRSAPKLTQIDHISCFDDPACDKAKANGELKQLYFDGTGSFRSVKGENPKTKEATVNNVLVRTDNSGNPTLHYYRAYIADLGEDGPIDMTTTDFATFCAGWTPGDIIVSPGAGTCDACPDVYQIEIHEGVLPSSPIMYTVGAFMNKGNYQIHRPTGAPN